MKIVTIIGARPQFIKAAAVSRAIAKHNQNTLKESDRIQEIIVHTGQHYDHNMSEVFFKELEIPEPHLNLEVGSGSHGLQTGQMLIKIEEALIAEKPDWVLVYGDTNSTLAGALAAVKLHIPVAHVEAGLRSYNRIMPEEINRVVTDHVSTLLFCPTKTAVKNLEKEGIGGDSSLVGKLASSSCQEDNNPSAHKHFSLQTHQLTNLHSYELKNSPSDQHTNSPTYQLQPKVALVGDVMFDSMLYNTELAIRQSKIIEALKLKTKTYALATVHRPENTDDFDQLRSIFQAFEQISSDGLTVVVPLHPRTQKIISESDLPLKHLKIIEPVSYLDMLLLEKNAKLILTDSGGVQKEAFWMKVPCITLRNETEWIETVEEKWNTIAGANTVNIINSVLSIYSPNSQKAVFGDGHSADMIIHFMTSLDE